MKKEPVRCSCCHFMKVCMRAEKTKNNAHMTSSRGRCHCEHPDAIETSALLAGDKSLTFIAFTKGGSDVPDMITAPHWCPRKLLYEPRKITKQQAYRVIDKRRPYGLFYVHEDGCYTGIDNRNGEAWTEEFKKKDACFKWLKGSE